MLHNEAKSLIIINAKMLCEPAKNPTGLVPLKCPISLELVFKYPLVSDNIGATGAQNQVPSVVGHEGDILFLHSRPTMRIDEGGPEQTLGQERESGIDVELVLLEADSPSGLHRMQMIHGTNEDRTSQQFMRHRLGGQR
jgi:hypothetical protein